MKVIGIPIETTEEERRQAAQDLAWVLAQIAKEEERKMRDNAWVVQHFYCRQCLKDGGKLQPLVEVWSRKQGQRVVVCAADRSHVGMIRKSTAEYLLNAKGGSLRPTGYYQNKEETNNE